MCVCVCVCVCVSAAAALMHKYQAHAATDVTGFGLLGHANNLAKQQCNDVAFVIHNLPIIAKMAAVSKACGNLFNLVQGMSAETSGRISDADENCFFIRGIIKRCQSGPLTFLLLSSSLRWTAGESAQRAGSQVLCRDEEPQHWRSGVSGRSLDHWNCGEGRPTRSHH